MPINLGFTPSSQPAETQQPPSEQQPPQEADLSNLGGAAPQTPQTPPQPQPQPSTGVVPGHQTPASFLMTGEAQNSAVQQVKATQDLRAKLRTDVKEFWLDPGQFAKLVFLDGKLLSDNVFDTPMVSTHMLQIGGSWHKLICNKQTEGQCIICDSNADGSQPATVQLFTVINVMPYVIQSGPNRGKTMPARLQLFAATMKTRERLIQRAKNHGGTLAGGLYQFSRADKQAARTGDDIEFIQDVDLNAVLKKFPMLNRTRNAKGDYIDAPTTVIDYGKAYPVLTNAEIAAMRPDLASMAGYNTYAGADDGTAPVFGSDPTGEIDDELPF